MRLYYAIIGSYVPVAAENDAYIHRIPPSASLFSRALRLDGYRTARASIERLQLFGVDVLTLLSNA